MYAILQMAVRTVEAGDGFFSNKTPLPLQNVPSDFYFYEEHWLQTWDRSHRAEGMRAAGWVVGTGGRKTHQPRLWCWEKKGTMIN